MDNVKVGDVFERSESTPKPKADAARSKRVIVERVEAKFVLVRTVTKRGDGAVRVVGQAELQKKWIKVEPEAGSIAGGKFAFPTQGWEQIAKAVGGILLRPDQQFMYGASCPIQIATNKGQDGPTTVVFAFGELGAEWVVRVYTIKDVPLGNRTLTFESDTAPDQIPTLVQETLEKALVFISEQSKKANRF